MAAQIRDAHVQLAAVYIEDAMTEGRILDRSVRDSAVLGLRRALAALGVELVEKGED